MYLFEEENQTKVSTVSWYTLLAECAHLPTYFPTILLVNYSS